MEPLAAYDYILSGFAEIADRERTTLGTQHERGYLVENCGAPPYEEVIGDRFLTIAHVANGLDAQWDAPICRKLDLFVDLERQSIELLWAIRCIWFDFDADADSAADNIIARIEENRDR